MDMRFCRGCEFPLTSADRWNNPLTVTEAADITSQVRELNESARRLGRPEPVPGANSPLFSLGMMLRAFEVYRCNRCQKLTLFLGAFRLG